jgi:hypothetical protein
MSEPAYSPLTSRTGVSLTRTFAALFALCVVGCGDDPPDSARFDVSDIQRHRACLERAFPLEPPTFDTRRRIDSVGVFMLSRVRLQIDADLVYIEVFRPEEIRERLGEPIEVEPDLGPQPSADRTLRVEVELRESCSELNTTLLVRGDVVFQSFPPDGEGRIRGRFEGASIISARTGDIVAEEVSGRWQFEAPDRSPYPTFEGDEYRTDP